jgi:hypothetical protein
VIADLIAHLKANETEAYLTRLRILVLDQQPMSGKKRLRKEEHKDGGEGIRALFRADGCNLHACLRQGIRENEEEFNDHCSVIFSTWKRILESTCNTTKCLINANTEVAGVLHGFLNDFECEMKCY